MVRALPVAAAAAAAASYRPYGLPLAPPFRVSFVSQHVQLYGRNACSISRIMSSSLQAMGSGSVPQTSTMISQEEANEWVKKDNRRMLHVVYRVGDLEKTIKFYTECLGMKLLRKRDIPEERYTNAFLGYGPEDSHFVVELTYNYGVDKYDIGSGFGHFGIAVDDVAKSVDLIKAKGGKVTREPGPVKGGKSIIAFIEDPDGYKFELIERATTPEPLCQVMLRVGDLDRSINFYEKAFGMELLRKRDNPEYKYTIAMMGYGPEDKNAVLELTYNYGVREYDKGNAYGQGQQRNGHLSHLEIEEVFQLHPHSCCSLKQFSSLCVSISCFCLWPLSGFGWNHWSYVCSSSMIFLFLSSAFAPLLAHPIGGLMHGTNAPVLLLDYHKSTAQSQKTELEGPLLC